MVAELSANHRGRMEIACDIVRYAAVAGADAIKFQTFRAAQMVGNPKWVIPTGPWAGRAIGDLYAEAETPRAWHPELFALARRHGLVPISTPFEPGDVQFLETLECAAYKIASFEIQHHALIKAAASTGKPVIISTGMADVVHIADAVDVARAAGCKDLTLLKCTSAYPAPEDTINLLDMAEMRSTFQCDVGLSDHTLGIGVSIGAAALGATIIEKHLTTSRESGGPDAAFSMEPGEFSVLCREARRAHAARGEDRDTPAGRIRTGMAQVDSAQMRRSLWYARGLLAGETLVSADTRLARPSAGLNPDKIGQVLGRSLRRDVRMGEPVSLEDFHPTTQQEAP